ncbi:MAG: multidrug effflux MFS transporter [Pseudomonadota bacterium]
MSVTPNVRLFDRTTPPHMVTLVLIAGISAMNMSVFLPSLAHMADYFDTSYATMQLAVSGYLAVTVIPQLLIGPISDKIGRRPLVLGSILIFVAASVGAMLSQSIEAFLIFRMLQAAVVTNLVLSRSIVRDMVPQDQAASMIGYVTMGMALIPMIGPMIGGALDELFGWQSNFAFLAIAGVLVFGVCYFDLGETVQDGGLGFREQVKSYPELFASPRFWGYALCTAFASGAFFALLGGASFVAVEVFDLTPFWSGVGLGAPAVGYVIGNFLSGRFATALGINKLAFLGTIITVIGLGVSLFLALIGLSTPLLFFGFCTFMGLGNGMTMPNGLAGMLSVRPRLAGTASGLGGAIMVGGGAALSQFAGGLLTVESGTVPLQWLMVIVSVLAMVSILFVIWREKQITA